MPPEYTRTRIVWKPHERQAIVAKAVEFYRAFKYRTSKRRMLTEAMKATLPPERHRHISSIETDQFAWFHEGLADGLRQHTPTPPDAEPPAEVGRVVAPEPEPNPEPERREPPALVPPTPPVEPLPIPPAPLLGNMGADGLLVALLKTLFDRQDLQRQAVEAIRAEMATLSAVAKDQVDRMTKLFSEMDTMARGILLLVERIEDVATNPALSPEPPRAHVSNFDAAVRRVAHELTEKIEEATPAPLPPHLRATSNGAAVMTPAQAELVERTALARSKMRVAVIGIPSGHVENGIRDTVGKKIGVLKFFKDIAPARLLDCDYVIATRWAKTEWIANAKKVLPANQLIIQSGPKENIAPILLTLQPSTL